MTNKPNNKVEEIDRWMQSDEVYDILPPDGKDDRFIDLWNKKKKLLQNKLDENGTS